MTGANHWLKVLLNGTQSNRSAIGARALVRYSGRTQAQPVLSQSSYYSCSDSRLHFGLGEATAADITVHWPSGATETYRSIKCDRLITIREGKGIVPNFGWARS
jgi:hypothetical protein